MRLKDMLGSMQLTQKKDTSNELWTVWGEEVRESAKAPDYVPLPEYPRPQMVRSQYEILNGWWEYCFLADADWKNLEIPREWEKDGDILVPFSPESSLSGVNRQLLPDQVLCYRRKVQTGRRSGERLLLHFGAVDQECIVFWNGQRAGVHSGGYLPFTLDVTKYLTEGENELQVYCLDESDRGYHTRGKQKLDRGGMFYTAQSGIWQTVWTEWVPETYIADLMLLPDYDQQEIKIRIRLAGSQSRVRVSAAVLEPETYQESENGASVCAKSDKICSDGKGMLWIKLPGMHPWTPEDPYLYQLRIQCGQDRVESYFAMRCFTVEQGTDGVQRFCLNHQPTFLNGVLDQGYWPDGLYTAPMEQAMETDIRNMQKAGFNMLRKHCKIEPLRWYGLCDRLGMLVWQDMINGGETYDMRRICYLPTLFARRKGAKGHTLRASGRLNEAGRHEWVQECRGTIHHLRNVPSLAGWVIFNEGWGQFSTVKITEMVKKLDHSRPVDAASGWFDFGSGDFRSEHNYFSELVVPKDRRNRAAVISEYGGLALSIPGHVFSNRIYGYRTLKTQQEFEERFRQIQKHIRSLEQKGLSGAVYTQVSDVEEEINGLYTYDRKICKVPPHDIS